MKRLFGAGRFSMLIHDLNYGNLAIYMLISSNVYKIKGENL